MARSVSLRKLVFHHDSLFGGTRRTFSVVWFQLDPSSAIWYVFWFSACAELISNMPVVENKLEHNKNNRKIFFVLTIFAIQQNQNTVYVMMQAIYLFVTVSSQQLKIRNRVSLLKIEKNLLIWNDLINLCKRRKNYFFF